MIDCKELRIGNWVYYIGEHFKITAIRKNDILDGFEPIPLDAELLVKCGFVQPKNDGSSCWVHKSNLHNYLHNVHATLRFAFIEGKLSVSIGDDNYGVIFARIQYLHELQNIWYTCNFKEEINYQP